MRLRRGYVIALAVATIAAIASILVPHGAHGLDPEARAQQAADALAHRHLPEAMAALERLRVPPRLSPYRRRLTVVSLLPGAGAHRGWGAAASRNPEQHRCLQRPDPCARGSYAGVSAGVNRAEAPLYQRMHIAAPSVVGCGTARNAREGTWTQCAYPAVVAENSVAVFLGPYFACSPGPCRWTDETEVDITQPSGMLRAAH
jgi:hypothetical protein